MLTAIDICGGGGGWSIAARGLPIRIVAAFDWAKDCCETYRYNFPETEVHHTDVRYVDFSKYQGTDLVLGGVPCEEISVARANFAPDRETIKKWHALLDAILHAVDVIRPRFWSLENVIQMRKHLPPLTPQWVGRAELWSGQARKRMFIGNFPVPVSADDATVLRDYILPGPYIVQENTLKCDKISPRQWYDKGKKRVLDLDRKSVTITDFGSRHSRGFCIRMANGRERSLQFTEAAAIQGFPTDFVFVASQSRAWKMVAQAIPIPLGRAILQSICQKAEKENAA